MALSNIPAQRVPESAPHTPVAPRETAPYSRVRGGTRYTQVASTRRRRRNLVLGVVATVLAMVVLGAAIAFGSAASFVNSIGNRLNENVSAATKAVLAEQQASAVQLTSNWTDMSPFYMLLLGVDSNEARLDGSEVGDVGAYGAGQENYRTDTMILARVDPGNKKVALVSIHRDTLYPVDGTDRPQKINQAYSIGGVPKTIEVVSDFAGVPISHYAEINIDGLYAIVDALGGVEVDVPYDLSLIHICFHASVDPAGKRGPGHGGRRGHGVCWPGVLDLVGRGPRGRARRGGSPVGEDPQAAHL